MPTYPSSVVEHALARLKPALRNDTQLAASQLLTEPKFRAYLRSLKPAWKRTTEKRHGPFLRPVLQSRRQPRIQRYSGDYTVGNHHRQRMDDQSIDHPQQCGSRLNLA